MSNALKSYVEKYLLNPAGKANIDDEDGNEETRAKVVDNVADDEGLGTSGVSLSKLRARNAPLLVDIDPRYKGKKVSRKDLKNETEENGMDPDLMKYYLAPDDDEDEDDGEEESDLEDEEQGDDDAESGSSEIESEEEEYDSEVKKPTSSEGRHGRIYGTESGEDTDVSYEDDSDEHSDTVQQMKGQLEGGDSDASIDNEDYSRYADDDNEEDDSESDDDEEENEDDEENEDEEEKNNEDQQVLPGIKKFSGRDTSEETLKGQAVQSQLSLYDSLFECRISLQKVLQSANQLPQHDTYHAFLKQQDPAYTKSLTASRSACKKLLSTLLDLQEAFMKQSLKMQQVSGGKLAEGHSNSDEEITSSEDEEEKELGSEVQSPGQKRKLSLEEYEDVLTKRQATLLPFRDETITQWYEKTKLLSSQKGSNKFSGFEMSALQQLQNILLNKEKLVQRTQLVGTMRGNTQRVLGTKNEDTEVSVEAYDSEIFDDTDFYTRSLEEVLKAKVASSEDMNVVSRKWIQIQNLRRKAKKRVDTKASKGRKIRYEVFSKLQQYLAPSHPPVMEDGAISLLFGSLFGKSLERVKSGTIS